MITSVLRNSSAVTEPPGAARGWGRGQLQERDSVGIPHFAPKFSASTVQELLGWAEHSEVLPSGCC